MERGVQKVCFRLFIWLHCASPLHVFICSFGYIVRPHKLVFSFFSFFIFFYFVRPQSVALFACLLFKTTSNMKTTSKMKTNLKVKTNLKMKTTSEKKTTLKQRQRQNKDPLKKKTVLKLKTTSK